MPTPIDVLLQPVTLAVLAMYATLWALESLFPARALPQAKGARSRGLAGFLLFLLVSSYLPLLCDETLGTMQWFDLTSLGMGSQVALGLLVYEIVGYWYHRALHASDTLFRLIHQTHHSAERLDVPSAYYFHPLDMMGWTLVTSVGLVLIAGLSPAATTATVLLISFLGIFQHSNLRTPRWLGYFVQRPESHSFHHGRGLHRQNYADLPLIDLLFGTFENPWGFSARTGFHDGASGRVVDLLLGRDVSVLPSAEQFHPGAVDRLVPSVPKPESSSV